MPDKLPPAEVQTTTDYQKVSVRVRRDGASERIYEGHGPNEGDRVTDVIKKIYDDPATPEYVRRG